MCSSLIQLVQEAEDWGERLGELEEEMKMCERSHTGMLEDCANKDDRIKVKTQSHQTHRKQETYFFQMYIHCIYIYISAYIQ